MTAQDLWAPWNCRQKSVCAHFSKLYFYDEQREKSSSLSIKILLPTCICTVFSAMAHMLGKQSIYLYTFGFFDWMRSTEIFEWGSSRYWLLSIILYAMWDSSAVWIEKRFRNLKKKKIQWKKNPVVICIFTLNSFKQFNIKQIFLIKDLNICTIWTPFSSYVLKFSFSSWKKIISKVLENL